MNHLKLMMMMMNMKGSTKFHADQHPLSVYHISFSFLFSLLINLQNYIEREYWTREGFVTCTTSRAKYFFVRKWPCVLDPLEPHLQPNQLGLSGKRQSWVPIHSDHRSISLSLSLSLFWLVGFRRRKWVPHFN
jgi:hypothetical protein